MSDEHWQEGMSVCPFMDYPDLPALRHWWNGYGRCRNCGADYWQSLEATMPKLSQVLQGSESTWADQIDKESIEREAFYIHNVHATSYDDDEGRAVQLLVLDITVGGTGLRTDPRAVITLGRTDEREAMLAYFSSDNTSETKPLGPCITYRVDLKGGRTFWRLEDAPEDEALQAQRYQPTNGKRR